MNVCVCVCMCVYMCECVCVCAYTEVKCQCSAHLLSLFFSLSPLLFSLFLPPSPVFSPSPITLFQPVCPSTPASLLIFNVPSPGARISGLYGYTQHFYMVMVSTLRTSNVCKKYPCSLNIPLVWGGALTFNVANWLSPLGLNLEPSSLDLRLPSSHVSEQPTPSCSWHADVIDDIFILSLLPLFSVQSLRQLCHPVLT